MPAGRSLGETLHGVREEGRPLLAVLGTSALVELVVYEDRTPDLQAWLGPDVVPAASALVRGELATAVRAGADVLVTYDRRMADAAAAAGMRVAAP